MLQIFRPATAKFNITRRLFYFPHTDITMLINMVDDTFHLRIVYHIGYTNLQ